MAGKQHHHVWRMFQRGFGEKRGKDHHIWVYRKGVEPSQKGTGNFGVGRFFYGPEGSETDKSITDFENSVQGDILEARKLDDGAGLNPAFVAPLIAHLEIRSNFLRSELSNMTERMKAALTDHFSSTAKVRVMIKDYLKNNPEKVDAFLASSFVPSDKREDALKLIDAYVDNLPQGMVEKVFGGKVAELFQMANLAPDGIKEAHNKAILSIKPESPRIKALSDYTYTIYRPKHGQLILPDTCCAFVGRKNVAPFSQPKDEMHTVIIPISSEAAIVGRKGKEEPMELKTINRLLAGCAYDAFIARINDPTLMSLAGRIGKYAKMISDKEIRDLFAFEQMLSN
jgi:hypothetical protein